MDHFLNEKALHVEAFYPYMGITGEDKQPKGSLRPLSGEPEGSRLFNVTCLHDLFKICQVSKEKVSTALSYDFTLLFSLTELGVKGCHE